MVPIFRISYLAAGVDGELGEQPLLRPRLLLEGKDWPLDEAVEKLWRDALGPEGKIVYRE